MAIDPTLLPAVTNGLRHAASVNYHSASASDDVFEAFVLLHFLEAAGSLGWQYSWHDHAGPQVNLRFRKGPGRITTHDFTHAQLDHPDHEPLEAHLGIQITGRSKVAHEFDLAVLSKASADAARAAGRDPRFRDVLVHAEAKFYAKDLPLHLGRAMVGLSEDCMLAKQGHLVANQHNPNVCKLLKAHHLYSRYNVTPRNTAD